METTDLTTTTLQTIRDDIAKLDEKLSGRMDKLGGRMDRLEDKVDKLETKVSELNTDVTHMRIDMQGMVGRGELNGVILTLHQRMDAFHAQLVESNTRTALAQQDLQATLDQIMNHLAGHGSLHLRVDRCEQDIVDLKERVF